MNYLIANWKLYLTKSESLVLAKKILALKKPSTLTTVLCPSVSALPEVATLLKKKKVQLGSQNIAPLGVSTATGETSPHDIRDFGCAYVLIGHSERRDLGETDELVREKLLAVTEAGMVPVLCVGEPLAVRRRGEAARFVKAQLSSALEGWQGKKLLVAYEPIWAISHEGTGQHCPPEEAKRMANDIAEFLGRSRLTDVATVLYGGSVTGETIADYLDGTHFHGALVGHASTILSEWKPMLAALS